MYVALASSCRQSAVLLRLSAIPVRLVVNLVVVFTGSSRLHPPDSGCPLRQVFVANPNKPKPILDILIRNQERLVDFLTRFHTDRSEDEQFNDEKAYLIKQIKELKPAVVTDQ